MKKILLLTLLLLAGCNGNNSNSSNLYENIPEKIEVNGVSIEASSVNTKNIDNYLFRDDTVYVDLRPYSEVVKEGHIAGFSFYPYYELIATFEGYEESIKNEAGEVIEKIPQDNRLFKYKLESPVCKVGDFSPNYEESIFLLNELFPKDKYIFAISQSGLECHYFFNLLIQYGYDVSKLYNIGGFAIGTGFHNIAYKNIDDPKHLVPGNPLIDHEVQNITFDFMRDLTPIK